MSTAKLNAVGHHWVGELSDFRFNIKYRPGKINIDADTLSRIPMDINQYVTEGTEELSQDIVRATWGRMPDLMEPSGPEEGRGLDRCPPHLLCRLQSTAQCTSANDRS